MADISEALRYLAEAVKILGGLASFYAVVKLRKLEKRYLFKGTIRELIDKLDGALSQLNASLAKPGDHKAEVAEALNYLIVDITNIERKCQGDSKRVCKELLAMLAATRTGRYFWSGRKAPIRLEKSLLLDIYGKGRGLIRSLENDLHDQVWSRE